MGFVAFITTGNPYVEAKREFGRFLRNVRIHRDLSQLAVAVNLGLESAQSISNIERGLASFPAKHLKPLCELLKISPERVAERLAEVERLRLLWEKAPESEN